MPPVQDERFPESGHDGSGRGPGVRDVARLAGVSASTVSRTLRGSTAVAPATRDRVLGAAKEIGYSLPQAADRPLLVGALARFPAQWFFAEAIRAIEGVFAGTDLRLTLHNVGDVRTRQLFFERVVPLGQLDAVIQVASSFDATESRAIEGLGVPIVSIGGSSPGYSRVGIDEEVAARMATRHLIGLGHRDIGLISFAPGDDEAGRFSTRARRRGFESALSEAGIRPVPEWLLEAEGSRMLGGVRAAEELLTRPSLPSALFAMSDELAFGVLHTLRLAHIPVPEQMSVVGFDDHEMAAFADLTTVLQPVREQAAMAAALLRDQLLGVPTDCVDVNLPVRLVVRGSTGPARGDRPA